MRKLAFPLTIAAAIALATILVAPAQAQLQHTWISSTGNDAASCAHDTPCATFGVALGRTNAGGEVTCLDSGNFGSSFSISKSITFDCEAASGSWTSPSGTGTGTLNIVTAATDTVTLRGLDFDGGGAAVSGGTFSLIHFTGAGVLHLQKMKINKLRGTGNGLWFAPNGPARLDVSDSIIADNGTDTSAAGILVRPTGGGSANVAVSHTNIMGNVNGIFVDGSGGGGAVNLDVRDSVVTGSSNVGIVLATSGPAVSALIERTTVSSSLNVGVATSGAAAIARIKDSTIYGNVTGVAAFNGSVIRSYKNNAINGNLTDGTPLTAEGLN